MQHRSKKIKKSFFIILVVLIVLSGGSAIYLGNYYHSVDVEKYMNGSSEVSVEKFDKGWSNCLCNPKSIRSSIIS